jgi:hypothetical protein
MLSLSRTAASQPASQGSGGASNAWQRRRRRQEPSGLINQASTGRTERAAPTNEGEGGPIVEGLVLNAVEEKPSTRWGLEIAVVTRATYNKQQQPNQKQHHQQRQQQQQQQDNYNHNDYKTNKQTTTHPNLQNQSNNQQQQLTAP